MGLALVYVLTVVLVLAPWTARNERELDAFVPISTNVGWNAVIGHHALADGGFWSPAAAGVFAEYQRPNPEGEAYRNDVGVRLAREWAVEHPAQEIELSARKAYILWKDDTDAVLWQELGETPDFLGDGERSLLKGMSNGYYYVACALAVVGAAAGLRRKEPWTVLWLLIFAYWTLFHIAFFAEGRFHFPLLSLLSLAAGAGVLETLQALRFRLSGTVPATREAAG